MENVPNTIINMSMSYMFQVLDEDDEVYNAIDLNIINALLTLEDKFNSKFDDERFLFNYTRSTNMNYLINTVIKEYKELNDSDDYEDDDEDSLGLDFFNSFGISDYSDDDDDEDGDEDDENINPFDFLEYHLKGYNPKYKRSKNKRPKGIPVSKVFRDAKNAKRAYNRHGVIICNDKDAKKRDEKILKEFLKDFFPGDSNWIKEFRHDVLKRWMKMYFVTKKDLKELEKTHRKAQNAKRNHVKTEKTLDFARRVFNVPVDRWNDPSK